MLLGTSFLDRFIGGIFSTEQKVVLRLSELVAVLSGNVKQRDEPTIGNLKEKTTKNTQPPIEDEKHERFQVARQVVLKPYTQQLVLVKTTSNGLFTTEPIKSSTIYTLFAAANGVIDA